MPKKARILEINGCADAFTRLGGCRGCFMVGVWVIWRVLKLIFVTKKINSDGIWLDNRV